MPELNKVGKLEMEMFQLDWASKIYFEIARWQMKAFSALYKLNWSTNQILHCSQKKSCTEALAVNYSQ